MCNISHLIEVILGDYYCPCLAAHMLNCLCIRAKKRKELLLILLIVYAGKAGKTSKGAIDYIVAAD